MGPSTVQALTRMLTNAMKEKHDFIITFEPRAGDEKKRDLHIDRESDHVLHARQLDEKSRTL
jgi:hypothetical protein